MAKAKRNWEEARPEVTFTYDAEAAEVSALVKCTIDYDGEQAVRVIERYSLSDIATLTTTKRANQKSYLVSIVNHLLQDKHGL